MRIYGINQVYYKNINYNYGKCGKPDCHMVHSAPQPAFKGKFGTIVGGILGVACTTVASIVAAPAIIGLVGVGALAGAIGGDALEDKINGNSSDKT